MEDLEKEIKALIIEALDLEDITPNEIGSEELLFGDDIGLDSIDALELGMEIRKRYGVKIEAATDEMKEHFATVRSLARFIAASQETSVV